jgi:hypothetical protein
MIKTKPPSNVPNAVFIMVVILTLKSVLAVGRLDTVRVLASDELVDPLIELAVDSHGMADYHNHFVIAFNVETVHETNAVGGDG